MYINKWGSASWSNIIHFTATNTDANQYGARTPGLWATNTKEVYVGQPIDGDKNKYFDVKHLPLQQWISVSVSQTLEKGQVRCNYFAILLKQMFSQFVNEVEINGKQEFRKINHQAVRFNNVRVYTGDPWYPVTDGKVRNIFVKSNDHDDNKCQ